MSNEKLDANELRRLGELASPGPWTIEWGDPTVLRDGKRESLLGDTNYYPWISFSDGDWEFVAYVGTHRDEIACRLEAQEALGAWPVCDESSKARAALALARGEL